MTIFYSVERFSDNNYSKLMNDNSKLDDFIQTLNTKGTNDWEVYKIEEVDNGLLVFFKRKS